MTSGGLVTVNDASENEVEIRAKFRVYANYENPPCEPGPFISSESCERKDLKGTEHFEKLAPGCGGCSTYSYETTPDADLSIRKVEILRNGQVISNTNSPAQNVIVGEKIELTTRVVGRAGTASNSQWTIPGTRIANYVVNYTNETLPTNAVVTQLTTQNLTQPSIQFHWVDGSTDVRNVPYSVRIGSRTYRATARFNIKRPTGTVTGQIFGTPNLTSFNGNYGLWFGKTDPPPAIPGIAFSRSITIPDGFAGSLQWVQVWNKFRRIKISGVWYRSQAVGLDSIYPYETGANPNDSPGLELDASHESVLIDDVYEMYLMFRPDGAQSIWVPLKKIRWGWNAEAVKSSGIWSIVGTPAKFADSPVDATGHPVWSLNSLNVDYTRE